ncbi:hypothetical protein [Haloplanus aerogenes]|uniref:Uncharacterized protein n=1 Tax=Haloplanus aerogenes TaxID=660522 RepID=A0A3M0CZR6_9EURY|nr:hypothetical protein [Haloplanus aerogenes]AZH26724.1 hypothetical protein DU502_15670 [Haloplanus aerogenes]RMB12969.1 hypothetical protein ATH50_3127 [Haloplanus aerogenes]
MSHLRRQSGPGRPSRAAAAAFVPLQWGLGPADVTGVPGRAVASFLLVLSVAGVVRYWRAGMLARAVDATLDRPLRAPLYGVATAVLGWLVVAYAFGQALRLGGRVGQVAVALGVGVALLAGGFGFVVVGTGVTAALGDRRPWAGPLVGASISAVVLLALPTLAGTLVWVLVAATGLGGVARRWLHASQSVETTKE